MDTGHHTFLPVFSLDADNEVLAKAQGIFDETVVAVNINEIARVVYSTASAGR